MDGALESQLHKNVGRLRLARTKKYDVSALYKLISFIQEHQIRILHAHDTSLFLAALASLFPPFPAVVWHDHNGEFGLVERSVWLYRMGTMRVKGVIAVSEPLAEWARTKLHVPAKRVSYLPNFVCTSELTAESSHLPGVNGSRIVCVAALRPQKDHVTLLRAMTLVLQKVPTAHLILVGGTRGDSDYSELIRQTIARGNLEKHVSLLGERQDVNAILRACNVGVLSSAGEAFPLTLLEYGLSSLPVVATRVGQCAEILDEGQAGLLVPPGSPEQLAEALVELLTSPEGRLSLANKLKHRVEELYSAKRTLEVLSKIYDEVLAAV
jgi:glycosyltransferase involved in cell wall biosynthesis